MPLKFKGGGFAKPKRMQVRPARSVSANAHEEPCPDCHGTGKISGHPCGKCHGTGHVPAHH